VPDGCVAAEVLDVGVVAAAVVATGEAAVLELLPQAVTAVAVASMATVVITDRVMACIELRS
jgi:hypothetical protein